MKVIDLTMPYSEKVAGFKKSVAKTLDNDGWNASTLEIYSHAGTHIDAPVHFGVGNKSLDKVGISTYLGTAHVVHLENLKDGHLISKEEVLSQIQNWEKGESILIHTNWSKKLGTHSYRNGLPRISEELAHALVEMKVNMLGVEPPSVADVNNLKEVTRIHRILFEGGITIIEGLCQLDEILEEKVFLIALPIVYENGDGAPARVVALENTSFIHG